MDWQPVLDIRYGKYVEGFDWSRKYEFRRGGDGAINVFRLSDCSPYFNIANLYFREITLPYQPQ